MKTKECPKLEKCPIFIKNVFHNEFMGKTYRNLYCQAQDEKFKTCKRYIFSEEYGISATENILPNSTYSIDEIAIRMELKV